MEFEEQARRVNAWDRQLRENQKTLESVVDDVHRIMSTHADLKQACDSIESYQNDLEADLQSLSTSIDKEITELELQSPGDDDYARETAFNTAEGLNDALSQMEVTLKKIVAEYNRAHGLSEGSTLGSHSENPLTKVRMYSCYPMECIANSECGMGRLFRCSTVIKKALRG